MDIVDNYSMEILLEKILHGTSAVCTGVESKPLVRLIRGVERLGWILYGSDDLVALLGRWNGS